MFAICRSLVSAICRRPRFSLCLLGLLTLVGSGIWAGGFFLRTRYWEPKGHLHAAQQAMDQRDFAVARRELALCGEAWPDDPLIHFLLARASRRDGDFEAAEQHLLTCQHLEQDKAHTSAGDTKLEWALLQAQRGRLLDVETYLQACLRKEHPDTVLIWEVLSWELMWSNRLGEARHYLNLWLVKNPDEYEAFVRRAWVAEHLFEFPAALDDYERALALQPERDHVRLRVAEILAQQRRPGEALEHLQQLRQLPRSDAAVAVCLARCQHQTGHLQEAVALLDRVLADHPREAPALSERGVLALEMNQPVEAEGWLRQAADLEPMNRQINASLCQCLQRLGKNAEAKSFAARLAQTDAELRRMDQLVRQVMKKPHDPALRYEAGMVFLRNGFVADGLRWLHMALKEDPRHGPSHEALAAYYERTGEGERAAYHRGFLSATRNAIQVSPAGIP